MTTFSSLSKGFSAPASAESFFTEPPIPFYSELKITSIPPVNIIETNTCYEMRVAVPSMKLDDLAATVQNGILTLIGNYTEPVKKLNNANYTRREFYHESYERTFGLPSDVRQSEIYGLYANGLLTIVLPKIEEQENPISTEELQIPISKIGCNGCHHTH